MHENEFLTDPPRVILYNPITNKCTGAHVFLGAVPKTVAAAVNNPTTGAAKLREYYGSNYKSRLLIGADLQDLLPSLGKSGGDEADFSDIESLLLGPARKKVAPKEPRLPLQQTAPTTTLTYVTDVHIFPEDKFSEVKEKIYLVSGIPIYRQHLFYFSGGRATTTYTLTGDSVYDTDIRRATKFPDNIVGIPVDKSLYSSREYNRVDAFDTFRLIGDVKSTGPLTLYVVDLAAFTAHSRAGMADLLHDSFQFDIVYNGFILPFYPMLTPECFRDYIANEADMPFKYPLLAQERDTLASIYTSERNVISDCYYNAAAAEKILRAFGVSVTQMTAVVSGGFTQINIRNLFDRLRVSRYIPEIRAYVENGGKHYMIRKVHTRNGSVIQFPAGNLMKRGVTIAVSLRAKDQETYHAKSTVSTMENEQNRYLFLNIQASGTYYIRTIWNEEDEFRFDEIIKVMKKFTDPIIHGINNLGRIVFNSGAGLSLISRHNVSYQSLTICVFYRRIVSDNVFKMIKNHWERYIQAQIMIPRGVKSDGRYELLFRKGVHQFDTSLIERIMSASSGITLLNQYAYLSNNTIHQKWAQNYDGRVMRMSHRTTDIKFEVVDIREEDFAYFLTYLSNFIRTATADPAISGAISATKSYKDVRKLKKLREQDPDLYNLKKHGSNRIYSILCQNPRQPLIYTPEEVEGMPPAQVKKLIKYWNFTLGKPAYYGCPNTTYPHLSFITGIHPKGYCLPCCNKKERTAEASKKHHANKVCLSEHKYSEESATGVSRHVMGYGKQLDTGRLSRLPQIVKNLLLGTHSADFYIYGVPQHTPGVENVGLLYAAAAALNLTVEELAEQMAARLLAQPNIFGVLLRGALFSFFTDIESVATSIRELFVEHKLFSHGTQRFQQWSGLFSEILHDLFDLSVFTFVDDQVDGVNVDLYVDNTVRTEALHHQSGGRCLILIKERNKYYPIFALDTAVYFNTGEIHSRTFSFTDDTIGVLCSAIKYATKNLTSRTEMTPDLTLLTNFAAATGRKITKCYANKQNLAYAVDIDGVYFPIDYSQHNGVPVDFEPLRRDSAPRYEEVVAIIEALNDYISAHYAVQNGHKYHKISPTAHFGRAVVEGFRAGNLVFHVNGGNSPVVFTPITYDYLDVNGAILSRAPPVPDGRTRGIGEALYTNYLYQLFVAEFVNYLSNERNESLRKTIIDSVNAADLRTGIMALQAEIHKILADFPADLAVLNGIVADFQMRGGSKQDLVARISEGIYEFDRVTMAELGKIPHDKVLEELTKIVENFAVEGDFNTVDMTFSNAYTTCSEEKSEYCKGGKLIVNRPMSELISILAADLTNELKAKYLLNSALGETYISYFEFIRHPMETITIYHLNK